ncbi:MAG: hypothetical protein KBA06_06175 [Saprospiraceae bacterium]|nr:hypothetical protein [Saprospiraceae bacterium]
MKLLGIGSRVKHPAFGDGVIIRLHQIAYEICFMVYGIKMVGKDYDGLEIIDAVEAETSVSFSDAEKSLIKILRHWSGISEEVEMADKWDGGMMILQPKDNSLSNKEIPIETFFHKITMTRDRLRVMEQRVNASNLNEEEKLNLQQYITKIYGSLTTFNVLFKYKDDYFVGEKTK